ncbi:MAG: DUF2207 domain-containing protein, partial [Anaerolineales bacterium]|nr:DUF2207 domain-containing protein [Anaerolineales bacterium]
MKKRFPLIFLAITAALFTLVLARSVQAQTSDVEYTRYDVEITLNEDGTLSVREIQHVSFRDSFRFAFADIPLDLVGNIENIRVSGGDTLETVSPYAPGSGPFTYSVDRGSDSVYVEWEFFATDSSDDKVFIVEYDVIDGLWVYTDINRLEWRAIAEDREGVNVQAGTVTVNLPFTLADDELDALAFGPAYSLDVQETKYGEQLVFEATEAVKDGTPFQIVVDFPPGLVPAELQAWQIAEDTADLAYTFDRIDVEMVVQEDGRLLITEQQQISVDAGVMYTGFRELNRLFTDDITIEQISEGDQTFALTEDGLETCVYCYRVDETNRSSSWVRYSETLDEVDIRDRWAGETAVEWRFPELVRGESTTFTLVYLVDGVMRLNEDGTQEIAWTVVPGYDVPVGEAQVTVQLPGRMGLEDVTIGGGTVSRGTDGEIVIVPETTVSIDEAWQIGMVLPEGATSAAKPAWQHELEAEFAAAAAFRERQARIDLAWVVGKIGMGVTAVLATIVGWYLWGSRKVREMMGNYRTTPPSDLPPGLVAYLIDKTPTAKGALASLLHLAALGLVRVNMDGN